MKRFNIKSKAKLCLLILGTVVISCKKDLKQSSSLTENEATMPRAVYTNITENFNSYSNGISYPNTLYVQDFGNNQSPFSWVTNRTYISNPTGNDGSLRIKLLANQYGSSAGGVIGKTLISDGNSTEYQVKFKLKFASDFQFSLGGKLGLGLGFGKALAGCKGDSARAGLEAALDLCGTGYPQVHLMYIIGSLNLICIIKECQLLLIVVENQKLIHLVIII